MLSVPTAADSSAGSTMVTGALGNRDASQQSLSEPLSTAQRILSPPAQLLAQQPSTAHQQPVLQMQMHQGLPQQTIGQLLQGAQQQPSPHQLQGIQQHPGAPLQQMAQAQMSGLIPSSGPHQLQKTSVHLHQTSYQQTPVSVRCHCRKPKPNQIDILRG